LWQPIGLRISEKASRDIEKRAADAIAAEIAKGLL
jgi:hypothetical protein